MEYRLWEEEVWKPVVGYEDHYEVNNFGDIRKKGGKLIKPAPTHQGYMHCVLSNKGKKETKYVHIVVAEAFLPNPHCLPEVNHKNEVKSDNRVENLEWIDRKGNVNYGSAQKRRVRSMIGIGRFSPIMCGLDKSTRTKNYYQFNKYRNRKVKATSLPNEKELF